MTCLHASDATREAHRIAEPEIGGDHRHRLVGSIEQEASVLSHSANKKSTSELGLITTARRRPRHAPVHPSENLDFGRVTV